MVRRPRTATTSWGAACAIAVAMLGEVTTAVAQGPAPPSMLDHIHITLEYHGAKGCSEGEVFQHALSFHLYRWDVWAAPPPAPWRLVLTVTPDGDGFAGDAVLWDPTHAVRWGRQVDGPVSCVEVLKNVALALGLALDPPPAAPASGPASPPQTLPPAVSKPDQPTPQELPPPDPVPPLPPPAPQERQKPWFAAVMVGVDKRAVTAPAFGVVADVGYKVAPFSFAAQFHAVPSARWNGLDTVLFAGGLVACAGLQRHLSGQPVVLAVCAMGEGGEIRRLVPDHVGSHGGGALGAFGGRIKAEIPLGTTFYLQAAVDLLGIGQRGLYSGIVPAGTAGIGVGAVF